MNEIRNPKFAGEKARAAEQDFRKRFCSKTEAKSSLICFAAPRERLTQQATWPLDKDPSRGRIAAARPVALASGLNLGRKTSESLSARTE